MLFEVYFQEAFPQVFSEEVSYGSVNEQDYVHSIVDII